LKIKSRLQLKLILINIFLFKTRQEAQSLLNQIAQTRNSIRESEQTSPINPLQQQQQQSISSTSVMKTVSTNNNEMDIGQTIEIKSESKLPIEIDQKIEIDQTNRNNESSNVQILELSSDSSSDTASESAHEESTGGFNIKRFSNK
jgi:hypothetical protein